MTDTKHANKGANPYDDLGKRTSEHRGKLGWMIAGATAAVVAIIALVVVLFSGGDDGGDAGDGTGAAAASSASQETAAVTIGGEDLQLLPDTGGFLPGPGEDPAVGLPVPTLTGESFDGSEVVIDGSDGTPKMVVFLAHWCPHCQAEVPLIQQWIDDGGAPEGLDIYGVTTSTGADQPNYPPSNWISSEGWTPPVLLDDEAQSAAQSWGLTGFPFFVMVDADGNVWQRGSGEIPIEELDRLADDLVAGGASSGGAGSVDGLQTEVDLDPEGS